MRRSSIVPSGCITPFLLLALLGSETDLPAASAGPGPAASPAPESRRPGILLDRGVEALHAGLHERAEAAFLEAARLDPGDPEPHALRALSLWWRILADRHDRSLDPGFSEAVAAALHVGGFSEGDAAGIGTGSPSARARAFVGMAYVLRFHVRGLRREFREAARDARDGHALLERALEEDPTILDAEFALGAYNYFADSLPAIARGLRVVLRVPQGDAPGGLIQLRRLADSRARLATHARLLLALINASDGRRCYGRAIDDIAAGLARNPRSPLVHATAGTLQLRLGFYDEAARDFAAALEGAAGPGDDAARLRRQITLRLAEARVAAWRLPEAGLLLETLRREGRPDERETQTVHRLEDEIAFRRGQVGVTGRPVPPPGFAVRVGEALASRTGADPTIPLKALRAAAALDPGHPLPHLLIGEILLAQRRYAEADTALTAAIERAEGAPSWVAGWAEIDRGLALRALGRARHARGRFERASEVRRFRSSDRGLYEIETDRDDTGRCAE